MTSRAGIVVVHWRGMDDLLDCLRSLAPIVQNGVPIVVAVNAGGDFDESAAAAACPGLIVVYSRDNRGYAAGCNLGWHAIEDRTETILFLNNDVVVPPAIVEAVSRFLDDHDDAGIIGPPVVYFDDPARVWALGGRIERSRGYTRQIGMNSGVLPTAPLPVDYVNGSAIAVRTEVLRQLGGWDESYFHFFDEADLCERARSRGWRSYCVPAEPVRHKVSATTGNRGSEKFTHPQAYYFSRNRVRFFARNSRGWRRVTALLLQLPWTIYESAKALVTGYGDEASGRLAGLIDGLLRRSGERRGGW
jgi:hypothetical protein